MLPGMPGWGQGPGSGQNPVDPGYSPPWAQVRPPVDPGYSPPWAQVPGGGTPPPNWNPIHPSHPITNPSPPYVDIGPPVEPPITPPPVLPPQADDGNWVWAWSPQLGRWVWVKVPGEGEAGPKV